MVDGVLLTSRGSPKSGAVATVAEQVRGLQQ